jgi:hypothetical protein
MGVALLRKMDRECSGASGAPLNEDTMAGPPTAVPDYKPDYGSIRLIFDLSTAPRYGLRYKLRYKVLV